MVSKQELANTSTEHDDRIHELEQEVYELRSALDRMNADLDHWKELQLEESKVRRRLWRRLRWRIQRIEERGLDAGYLLASRRRRRRE